MANNYLGLGMLSGIGQADLNGDYHPRDAWDQFRPGQIVIGGDRFGEKIFKFVRNLSGSAFAQGDLVRRVAIVNVANITSGTLTSATLVAGFTLGSVYVTAGKHAQGKHVGMMMYVVDNDDSAGAAPENEVSIIDENTADVAYVDPDYPFTVALAANDDLRVLSPGWHAEDSVAGDYAQNVLGVVMGPSGISDGSYGWVQQYGLCPIVNGTDATTFVANGAVIAGAAKIDIDANGGAELAVGFTPFAVTSDTDRDKVICFLKLFSPTLYVPTP